MNYYVNAKSNLKNGLFFRSLFFISIFFLSGTLLAQETAVSEKGVFQFDSEVIDYGTIDQNSDGERTFRFKNIGKSPIIISNVKATCGCTVPTKPEGAVMPGESAEIGVKYSTKKIGAFSKTVTVMSNASRSIVSLKIKGNVLGVKSDSKLADKTE